MLSLLSFVLAFGLCAHAATYGLYHRLLVPGRPEEPFVKRGSLDVAGNSVSLQSASTDLALWLEKRSSASGALYQLALSSDSEPARAVSSVKLVRVRRSAYGWPLKPLNSVTLPRRHPKPYISTSQKTTFHSASTTLYHLFLTMAAAHPLRLRPHPLSPTSTRPFSSANPPHQSRA